MVGKPKNPGRTIAMTPRSTTAAESTAKAAISDAGRSVDVVIVGGGFAGMCTAARLQAAGLSTVVLEAHSLAGGCAGYFRRAGFSFDVGATTLVDFEPHGVGGEFLNAIGMEHPDAELLPGYVAWLPDRTIDLYRERSRWHVERLAALGSTQAHQQFWTLLDRLADVFWQASRNGIKLPIQRPADLVRAARIVPARHWLLARYAFMTLGDALRRFGLEDDDALVGLLAMLVEDTVHARVDDAPLINAALGITIRGAGLSRASGGMRGFVTALVRHYIGLGGRLIRNCRVERIGGDEGNYSIQTSRGLYRAARVVSAVPAETTAQIAPVTNKRLGKFIRRDRDAMGGAIVVFLGVPEDEVADHEWTHHQILTGYNEPLGEGNNMFVSVSAPGDTQSAPPGHRAVMISTHCDLEQWRGLDDRAYEALKASLGSKLIDHARRIYPRLGENAVVSEVATPRTYARFASRPGGAVGGAHQTLRNSNQFAIPNDIGIPGFYLVGDTTWPGLGTVACTLGSRLVAEKVVGRSLTWQRAA